MEQQQIHVSFSLRTKLLLGIVLLLIFSVGFLNISTLLIVSKDKRAYVYRYQAKEALLAGSQFENLLRHSIDTLRTAASVTAAHPEIVEGIVDNQSDLSSVSIYRWDATTHALSKMISATKKDPDTGKLKLSDYDLTAADIEKVSDALVSHSFAYLNMNRPGAVPMLGVFFADSGLIGFGLASLGDYARQVNNFDLTISDLRGNVLFDTNTHRYGDLGATSLLAKNDPLFKSLSGAGGITEGSQEIDIGGVTYLGSYYLPGLDIAVMNRTPWKEANRSVYLLGEKFISLALLIIGVAIVYAILFSKRLSSPILRLFHATREIAAGNFNVELEKAGNDEIGALTESFGTMSKKIGELIIASAENANLEKELEIAATVQQTLFPAGDYITEEVSLFSHYESASQCGGDWWGFFRVRGKLCIMIADATGHGFPSALITASARSCFSVIQKQAEETPSFSFSAAEMLSYANRVIYEASLGKIMMTFFIGVIDLKTGRMTYSSAGHNPPWLFKKGAEGFSLHSLVAEGTRLGEVDTAPPFQELEIKVDAGDLFFLYTDGLTEGMDPDGNMFGKKRVLKKVKENLANGAQTVISELMVDFRSFSQGRTLNDDVTIAVASFSKIHEEA